MVRNFAIHCKWVLVGALIVALAAVGFAHRVIATEMTPELAAYVAGGGSLSDLCGTTSGSGETPVPHCEACRIADSFVLSQAGCAGTSQRIAKIYAFDFIAKRLAESGRLDNARMVRAPPQA
ncbi:hypothetical protein [Yoonia sp. BS5-3]|uniref:DUF2946 domain-containing protein n=1 Tax=Yoonia phaeophyticola TaxID=3137369 RepID=A0ABZ2V5M8_9RHOB